jgi:hypothetical protein
MKEQEIVKMELLLTLNDNIVVQRFFNVRNFNSMSKNSIEFYESIKGFTEELIYHLKMKTVIYMIDNQELINHDISILNTSYTDGPENFNIYVKIGDETICHRIFDGKIFPPKVRYTVDVRPFLKDILRELTDIFSEKKLNHNYLNFELGS